jgi:hypothetical protein
MQGVMIYIVVYKELSLALSLDSAHTKTWLQKLHPNIQGTTAHTTTTDVFIETYLDWSTDLDFHTIPSPTTPRSSQHECHTVLGSS